MATIEEKNHDSSATITDHYDAVTDTDGAITVIAGAALASSTLGVKADYDAGTNLIILRDTLTYSGGGFALRFRVNMANISSSAGSTTIMGVSLDDTPTVQDQSINIRTNVGNTAIEAAASVYDEGTASSRTTSWFTISSSGEVCLEMRVTKETADGNNDGTMRFYIDSVLQAELTDVQNFNVVNNFDRFHVAFTSNIAALSGFVYFDELILDDNSEADLGCSNPLLFTGYDLVAGGGQP